MTPAWVSNKTKGMALHLALLPTSMARTTIANGLEWITSGSFGVLSISRYCGTIALSTPSTFHLRYTIIDKPHPDPDNVVVIVLSFPARAPLEIHQSRSRLSNISLLLWPHFSSTSGHPVTVSSPITMTSLLIAGQAYGCLCGQLGFVYHCSHKRSCDR